MVVRDVGTRFEATTAPEWLQAAVAQGRVDVHSAALAHDLSLMAGRAMTAIGTSGMVETHAIDSSALGRPPRDHLDYREVPLGLSLPT